MSERAAHLLLVLITLAALAVRLAPLGQPPDRVPTTELSGVIMTGSKVNLRADPDLAASVVAQASRGTRLSQLGSQGDWYAVQWPGPPERRLWVSKLYAINPSNCATTGSAQLPELLRLSLTGEWKGRRQRSDGTFADTTFIFLDLGEQFCGYVVSDGGKQVLATTAAGSGALTLRGTSWEELEGGSKRFSLDTFSGSIDEGHLAMAGSYVDASGSRGEWEARKTTTPTKGTTPESGQQRETAQTGATDEENSVPVPAADLPAHVAEYLREHNLTLPTNISPYCSFQYENGNHPYFTSGDYDGDGVTDFAVDAERSQWKAEILVFFGDGRRISLQAWEYIYTERRRGKIASAWDEINLSTDALGGVKCESSSVLYVYNKTTRAFDMLFTSD